MDTWDLGALRAVPPCVDAGLGCARRRRVRRRLGFGVEILISDMKANTFIEV